MVLAAASHARARQRLDRGVDEVAGVDRHARRRDGHHRLDGGHDLAHVADIGGAQPVRDGLALGEPSAAHVGGEEVQQGRGSA